MSEIKSPITNHGFNEVEKSLMKRHAPTPFNIGWKAATVFTAEGMKNQILLPRNSHSKKKAASPSMGESLESGFISHCFSYS